MKSRNLLLVACIALFTVSCNSKGQTEKAEIVEADLTTNVVDASITHVYYFHGKQRCKTCIAVGDLAKKTIKETFADNDKVKFVEVNTSEKEFADLVKKYEVSWNALIIAKGDQSIDLTEQAFANAINSPKVLEQLIKDEVNKNI